ncbi:MAG: primosomal protein N' [bacterium]
MGRYENAQGTTKITFKTGMSIRHVALVALDIPYKQSLYYSIAEEFQDKIREGHLVVVPLRSQKRMGIVTEIAELDHDTNQGIEFKEIISLVYDEPILDPSLMKLAEWISDYYLCSYGMALKALIPDGLIPKETSATTRSIGSLDEGGAPSYVTLCWNKSQINDFKQTKGKRAYRQALVLEQLLESDGEAPAGSIPSRIIQSLQEQGAVKRAQKHGVPKPYIQSHDYGGIILSSEQNKALKHINDCVENQYFATFLLHGITGSGKTEIYLRAIQRVVDKGKQAILLAPEIAITHQLIQRFNYFFDDHVAVLHSRLSRGERKQEWLRIRKGHAKVVIGARSAIFAPALDLGLIIVDEEHDSSYKQDMTPRYNGRDIAVVRAKITDCPVILGSATPSLESYHNALSGKYRLLTLNKRPTAYSLPPITILDLRDNARKAAEEEFIISDTLKHAIEAVLHSKKQVLIFQNRRGYAPYLLCPKCGYVPKCSHCNVSLTYHRDDNSLKCHYCECRKPIPMECRFCKDVSYQYQGYGTQKIEEYVKKLFPNARIARMDRDSMSRKGSHGEIIDQFENREIDILIGTQMITKGLHLPDIVLVGVIGSDNILHLPDFRAAEKTFQMVMQVSGRCGRGDKPGHVLLQTFTPAHYSIQYAAQHNYSDFYKREIQFRRQLYYPPFSRVLNIIVKGKERKVIAKAATSIKKFLISYRSQHLRILGPSQAPLSKLRNLYRYQIIIKAKDHSLIKKIGNEVNKYVLGDRELRAVKVELDVDPVNLL